MQQKIVVIGAGSWGTALSMVLADNGHDVRIWGNSPQQLDEINEFHTNKQFLPDIELPKTIVAYHDLRKALEGAKYVLVVVPTKAIRPVMGELKKCLTSPITVIHASKGIEPGTSKRISEMIYEELPEDLLKDLVVLSGPSHAEEVSVRQPTTVASASENLRAARKVQELFSNQYLRVYTNPDMIGVEIGGALKNIIALAAGVTAGLGYGDNAKAALMTRGLAEMTRLGMAMGANPLTFAGLAGLGDLIVTCTSVHSRNWRAGNLIGKGHDLDEVLENMGMVVEGVRTTEAAYELGQKLNVDLPITNELYGVLFKGVNPKEAVERLMTRNRKDEF